MKSTGIVRKVDELGRVVIPIELRRNLGIEEKDALEIFVQDENIILKKYVSSEVEKEKASVLKGLEKIGEMTSLEADKVIAEAIRLLRQK